MEQQFNPSDAVSSDFGIFGIPTQEETSRLVLLPVPWEVTTSYGKGASNGPRIIRQASEQIDLFDLETGKAYEAGYHMREISQDLLSKNKTMKDKAQKLMQMRMDLSDDTATMDQIAHDVNKACEQMVNWVYEQSKQILKSGKLLGLIGGDHSTPQGAIRALCEQHKDMGVLHIDAHADLRKAYQGFTNSHASIMYNVMTADIAPKKLVQVGIRDFCEEEFEFIQSSQGKIKTYFDIHNKRRLMQGESWASICKDIVNDLPDKVYISFDIDGLDPALCPNTGTPVAGGMSLDQLFYLFHTLSESGKQIVGFDLNEVSSGDADESEWDGNVGARVLYKLCGWTIKTNGL